MLSIGKLTRGREDYYLDALAATTDEYYLDPSEIPGRWQGSLAGRLGLEGRVDAEGFRAVLAGRHPDGHALVVGADAPGRVTGFDLTFSAPKSVSLLWALGSPETAEAVAAAHDGAVADALAALEAEAVRARRGHDGLVQVKGAGLVAAGFGHRTSRAGDPQLHTHLVVANLTVGPDGRWSAPDGRALYGWAQTTGYLYQAALRARLTETLGLSWTEVRKGVAEIQGVTAAQRDAFSTRRAQIRAELERVGQASPAATRTATLASRSAKDRSLGLDELRARWSVQARELGLKVEDLLHPARPVPRLDLAGRLLAAGGLTARATGATCSASSRAGTETAPHPPSCRPTPTGSSLAPTSSPWPPSTTAGGRRWSTAELVALETRLVEAACAVRATGPASPRNRSSPRSSANAAVSPPNRSPWSPGSPPPAPASRSSSAGPGPARRSPSMRPAPPGSAPATA